jgi:LL-diaminopimelate aminotransferase
MIAALAKVKSNIDSGAFQAVQMAGIAALKEHKGHIQRMNRIYQTRRDRMAAALRETGWKVSPPRATFYLWVPLPTGCSSKQVASLLLRQAGIVATPGIGFGRYGEGYIRFSLSVPTPRLREAAQRLTKLSLWPSSTSA